MTAKEPTEIVVLGGGYVGVWAARRIARGLRRRMSAGDVRLTLVSASDHHAFHGWTAEVITGHVRPDRARVRLDALVPAASLVVGAAIAIDLDERRVEVLSDDGVRLLPWDHLVVGVGSTDASHRVPGLAEHGWSVKAPGGLEALDTQLTEVVARASATSDAAERRTLLTAVVAGGGLAGAEVAAAISDRLCGAVADSQALGPTDAPRVVLVHSGTRLMPDLRPGYDAVADYAEAQTARAGVELRRGARLTAVSPRGAVLADGSRIDAATVVSALGQTPVALPGTGALLRDAAGRLATDRFLRTASPGVWAGGDVAAVPHPSGRGPCRADALWAIHHGIRIGANIVRDTRGRRPRPFRFPGLGRAASFGIGRGAGELYGIPLKGWAAWLPRWVLFHYYMPSRRVALANAADWLAGRRFSAEFRAGAQPATPPVAAPAAARVAQSRANRSVAATRAAAIPGSVAE